MGSYRPDIKDVVSTFIICEEVQALRLRVRCFDFMVQYFGVVSSVQDFSTLKPTTQAAIKEKAAQRAPDQIADELKLLNRYRKTSVKNNKN